MKEYEYNILENANEAAMMFPDDADAIEDRGRFVRNVGRLATQTREGVKRVDYLGGDPELVGLFSRTATGARSTSPPIHTRQ